jgi:formate-dependent nitrite reductase membrane component NrfD
VDEAVAGSILPEVVALAFLAVTVVLLIHDLGRPERFWRLLFTPNTKSWLVKGGWFLTAFGAVAAASAAARLAGADGAADALRWANVPLAVMTSGYSAFLFAQCRARDLWLARSLFASLVLEALLCGAAFALVLPGGGALARFAAFVASVVVVAVLPFVEAKCLPDTDHARRAHAIQAETARREQHLLYLLGAVVLGTFGWSSGSDVDPRNSFQMLFLGLAACFAAAALLLRARAWVRAGQAVPIS